MKHSYNCIDALRAAGISYEDATALRRVSTTLHRWHELECGDGNSYGSWAIERDDDGDGPPFMVHHHFAHGRGADTVTRTRIPDRERGALKRLDKILARYPTMGFYVQGDPRDRPRPKRNRDGDYPVDIRVEWVDFIDHLARDGIISESLAQRATL